MLDNLNFLIIEIYFYYFLLFYLLIQTLLYVLYKVERFIHQGWNNVKHFNTF